METYVGLSGVIIPNTGMGVVIKSIQSDVNTTTADGIWVAVSGSLGTTEHTFNAMSPIVGDFRFAESEEVAITYDDGGTSGELTNIVINYILYGDQIAYMTLDPSRIHRVPHANTWTDKL
jgi:hypothetical protein